VADHSKIEWTDATWSPTLGCTKVSPGCDNCYAIKTVHRLAHNPNPKIQMAAEGLTAYRPGVGVVWTGAVRTLPDRLDLPLRWRKPRMIFVDSQSDLFHDHVPDEFIARVFAVMAATPRHTYQILTKRHARMRSLLSSDDFRLLAKEKHGDLRLSGLIKGQGGPIVINAFPPKNVWLGVSVEDQQWADIRIPALLDTPAAVRWLSCEPLLGPVNLAGPVDQHGHRPHPTYWLTGRPHWGTPDAQGLQPIEVGPRIDWVVVGGESGHGARPMHPDWARALRDQCQAAGVPFLFKQWGEWGPAPWKVPVCDPAVGWQGTDEELAAAKADSEARGATHAYASWAHEYGHELYEPPHKPWSVERADQLGGPHAPMRRWGKKQAGRELDGRTHDEFPEVSARSSFTTTTRSAASNQGGDQ
jgi:protein gp37